MNFSEEREKYGIIHIESALENAFNAGIEWCLKEAEAFDGGAYLQPNVKLAFKKYIKKIYGVEK